VDIAQFWAMMSRRIACGAETGLHRPHRERTSWSRSSTMCLRKLERRLYQRGHAESWWNSTVSFVAWDDFGGFYDHVPPPAVDTWGLGPRVGLLTTSPFAKSGYIEHTQLEFSSIVRFSNSSTDSRFSPGGTATRRICGTNSTLPARPRCRCPCNHRLAR